MTDTTPVPPMSETPVPKIDVRALNPLLDGLAKLTDAEATITRLENDNSNLRAEVERLNLLNTHLDRAATTIGKKCDALRATVAEQGAALAELVEKWRKTGMMSATHFGDNTAYAHQKCADELEAALASAQSREQGEAPSGNSETD